MIEELIFDNIDNMLSAVEEFYSSHEGSEVLPADSGEFKAFSVYYDDDGVEIGRIFKIKTHKIGVLSEKSNQILNHIAKLIAKKDVLEKILQKNKSFIECSKHGNQKLLNLEHVTDDGERIVKAFCIRCVAESMRCR